MQKVHIYQRVTYLILMAAIPIRVYMSTKQLTYFP